MHQFHPVKKQILSRWKVWFRDPFTHASQKPHSQDKILFSPKQARFHRKSSSQILSRHDCTFKRYGFHQKHQVMNTVQLHSCLNKYRYRFLQWQLINIKQWWVHLQCAELMAMMKTTVEVMTMATNKMLMRMVIFYEHSGVLGIVFIMKIILNSMYLQVAVTCMIQCGCIYLPHSETSHWKLD